MRGYRPLVLAATCGLMIGASLEAAGKPQVRLASEVERINDGVVSVISGTPGGTYFRLASDLSLVLDDEAGLRVLPVLGKGAGQNAYDLMYLKGIDLAFVRTDTIEQLKTDARVRNAAGQIAYIARLFNDELHVVARREITDVKQLSGKKVSFDVKGSGSDYSGRAMFEALGLGVDAVNIDQASALALLKRGEIEAVVSVAAKPVSVISSIGKDAGLHLLDVPYPASMADRYFPADIKASDYPELVPEGATLRTVAVGTILAAVNHPRNSERYERLKRFTEAFFRRFDDFLQPPRHPKWREVNLLASVAGWTRFQPAQDWIDKARAEAQAREQARQAGLRAEIQKFLEEKATAIEMDRERVLREYLSWRAAQGDRTVR